MHTTIFVLPVFFVSFNFIHRICKLSEYSFDYSKSNVRNTYFFFTHWNWFSYNQNLWRYGIICTSVVSTVFTVSVCLQSYLIYVSLHDTFLTWIITVVLMKIAVVKEYVGMYRHKVHLCEYIYILSIQCCPNALNPLNAELNPICHLLPLLGAHHILHISGKRLRWLLCNNGEYTNNFWHQ
jgi:hypothetical protein